MTTNYAPKGTPAPYDELRSLYLGIADYRNNVKARAQYAQTPHIPLPRKNKSFTTD